MGEEEQEDQQQRRQGEVEREVRGVQRRSEGRVATRWVVRLVQGARRKGPAGQLGRPGLGRLEGEDNQGKRQRARGDIQAHEDIIGVSINAPVVDDVGAKSCHSCTTGTANGHPGQASSARSL